MENHNIAINLEDFNQNTHKLYKKLLSEKHFTDVTLATNDDVQVKAHKVNMAYMTEMAQ